MSTLTNMEQINLLAFIKTMINKDVGENIKKDIAPIYFKLKKEFEEDKKRHSSNTKYSYQYNSDISNPITYYIQDGDKTITMSYKDALDIAYTVIDSLFGSYDYLDELTTKYEEERFPSEEVVLNPFEEF